MLFMCGTRTPVEGNLTFNQIKLYFKSKFFILSFYFGRIPNFAGVWHAFKHLQ